MGHNIYAIIGKQPVREEKLRFYQLAAAYEKEYAIVILERDSVWYWSEKLQISDESKGEHLEFACDLIFFWAKELGLEEYVLIQTDYHAGIGEQAACFYIDGTPLTNETDINTALRFLGITSGLYGTDEFDMLNLGTYRDSGYYYSSLYERRGKDRNIIFGKVPAG